jgi:glycosyltransferase involved in cell wall biosynthesis
MVYNFAVEEAHVTAPNFYQRCAESVFPDFGIKTDFLPDFKATWVFRCLLRCGILAKHAMLLCLVGWLFWHGRRYNAIVGWVSNGLLAAALKQLLRWRKTKVILILYRLPVSDRVTNAHRFKKICYRFASAGADVLLALDTRQALDFEAFLGRAPGTTQALNYGVDAEWYARHTPKDFIHEKHNPVIFSPGSAHRDDQTLEAAISQMRLTLQRYQLDSSGVQRSALERVGLAYIERQFNVDYFHYIRDCSHADIVVIAVENSDKPVGLTSLLECMALGRPIIITDGASSRDYIRDGIDGLVYEQGNAVQLKEKIELLINKPDLAAKLGEAAKKAACTRFGLNLSGQELIRFFNI